MSIQLWGYDPKTAWHRGTREVVYGTSARLVEGLDAIKTTVRMPATQHGEFGYLVLRPPAVAPDWLVDTVAKFTAAIAPIIKGERVQVWQENDPVDGPQIVVGYAERSPFAWVGLIQALIGAVPLLLLGLALLVWGILLVRVAGGLSKLGWLVTTPWGLALTGLGLLVAAQVLAAPRGSLGQTLEFWERHD